MTEDIAPDVLKRTQDTLGKFIKKPVLTEKLLRKPPFRFLHDICTSAMKETGFFEGVLSGNDTKAESIKDKDGKIAFLQKVIVAVESANNVKLSVKPNKIVAGHEPVKTNEFLQALATALEKQAGGANAKKQPKKPKPTDKNQEENVKKKNTSNKSQKPTELIADVPSKDIKKRKTSEKLADGALKTKEKAAANKAKNRSETLSEAPNILEENKTLLNRDNGENNVVERTELDENIHGVETIPKAESVIRPLSAKIRAPSARTLHEKEPVPVNESVDDAAATVLGNVVIEAVSPVPSPPPAPPVDPPSSQLVDEPQETPSKPQRSPTAHGKKEGETGIVTRPRTAIRPTTARPASARPAAPRVRERGQLQLQEEVIKPAAGKVNLIVEQEAFLADDEELVEVQTINHDILEENIVIEPNSTVPVTSEHGHLVSQILEAQKELEDDLFSSNKGVTEIEWGASRGIEATNKEVERLRVAIQTLTRSANPLGKLMEFLQEDVETMQQELEAWRNKNSNLSAKLDTERSLTDQSIEPLKTHLGDLQVSIDQQMEQIAALKATVLRRDEKITRMLTNL